MNIAIDTTPLNSPHARRGTGSYTRLLIDALSRYEQQHTYSLFTRGQKVPEHADLVHYPYFDPYFLTLPLMKDKPAVVTVHDLIPLVFPDRFPAGIRGRVKWEIQKISLVGCRRIITDSDCSKKDIANITGFDRGRIDVVYLAPDPVFAQKHQKPRSKPYFLYVGDVNWNKNIPGLLKAFASLRHGELVLAGPAFSDNSTRETAEIHRLISALGLDTSVHFIGFVSAGELAGLYAGAIALVQPSFYEGFGLPVLEAMSAGCPVIAADNSSLTEIAGPAVMVNPEPESIEAGMRKALTLDRKSQIRRQLDWVKRFSWKQTARMTVQSYEKVLESL